MTKLTGRQLTILAGLIVVAVVVVIAIGGEDALVKIIGAAGDK